tara:strand:+ start:7387 stop:9210 length:1824 start_codon:yes stop_codon:yes gene_type:complete
MLFFYVAWDNKAGSGSNNSISDRKAIRINSIESIQKLVISSGGNEITLKRNKIKGWDIIDPILDRANSSKVEELLETMHSLKKFDLKNSDTDGKKLGINDESASLAFYDNQQFVGKVTFGDDTGLSGTVYANWSTQKENSSFFCWNDAREAINFSLDQIRDNKLLKPSIEDIKEIEIIEDSGSSLTVLRESVQSNWMINKPLQTGTNSKSINEWLSKIINLSSQKFIDNSESITASYFNSIFKSIKVKQFQNQKNIIIDFANSNIETEAYARISDRPETIVRINKEIIKSIDLNPNLIRDKKLIPFNPKSVVAFNIEAKPNYKVNLLQDNNGWQIIENSGKIKADQQRVYKILDALSSETVENFVADAAGNLEPWGLNEPTLKISLSLVGLNPNKPEKEDGSPNLVDIKKDLLVKGQLAKNQDIIEYFATIKGSGTVAKLSPAFPSIIPIRALNYKELYLWPPFNISSIAKISTTSPPQIALELNYKYETNEWLAILADENVSQKIDQAEALKLAQHLSLPVRATRWLVKNTEEAEIALLEPIRKIEFTLNGSDNTPLNFKLEISPVNRTGNNLLYYCRVNDSKDICLIDKQNFIALDAKIIKQINE